MKKLFDRTDLTALGVVGLYLIVGMVGLLVGATTRPAEVRAHDPKPPVQSRELPDGIQRLYLDGHAFLSVSDKGERGYWDGWKGSFFPAFLPVLSLSDDPQV